LRKDAWRGSTRKGRLPVDWPRLRQIVLKECGQRCEWVEDGVRCNLPATDVDHIKPGDDHSRRNLQGLCQDHHKAKSSAEGNAAQARLRALRRLPEEPQPGVIDGPPKPPQYRGF